jgi:hypothetical protein
MPALDTAGSMGQANGMGGGASRAWYGALVRDFLDVAGRPDERRTLLSASDATFGGARSRRVGA